jgi:hypothetical protein
MNQTDKIEILTQLGHESLIRTKEFTKDYAKLGFTQDDVELLIEIALDYDFKYTDSSIEVEQYTPCHAIMALGQFEAVEALEPLLKRLDIFEDYDYYREALIYYIRKIAYLKIDVLIDYFLDKDNFTGLRILVVEGMEEALKKDKIIDKKVEEAFIRYLQRDDELDDFLNPMVIFMLIDITKDRHIDLIRQVFDTKPVDTFYSGDFEDIEVRLGLKKERTKPREKNKLQKLMERHSINDEFEPDVITSHKIGRNEPCPCGSGKKYKKCCIDR